MQTIGSLYSIFKVQVSITERNVKKKHLGLTKDNYKLRFQQPEKKYVHMYVYTHICICLSIYDKLKLVSKVQDCMGMQRLLD